MKQNPPHAAAGSSTLHPAISRNSIRLLLLSLLCAAGLFGWEVGHYFISTDVGTTDVLPSAWAYYHPLCKEEGGRFNVRCPFTGYNSVPLICLEAMCTNSDPEMAVVTEQLRADHLDMLKKDKIDSLRVEEPYGAKSPEWRVRAHDLVSGGESPMNPVVLDRRVETMPEAQRLVVWRSLQVSRQVADDWMKQHGS